MTEPTLTPHSTLVSQGLTRADVRALEREGSLSRVRRGVYRSGPDDDQDDRRHRLLVRATWPQLADGAVVSHSSAAVLHGLPLLGPVPTRVSVTRPERGHGRADTVLHLRRCPVPPDEVVELGGVLVTTLARTVVDIARSASLDQGVVVADAALRQGLDRQELYDCVTRARQRPGVSNARRVATFADGLSGSPGESVSRVRMQQANLPAPVLQFELTDEDGRTIIPDFAWPDLRTVGEFDGKVKYGALVPAGRTAADVVMAEKSRENRIRRHGLWVVRWSWQGLGNVTAFGAKIRQAFENAPRYLAAG